MTVVPASSVRAMAATDGCACAANRVSSHQAARSAPQKPGSLRAAGLKPERHPTIHPEVERSMFGHVDGVLLLQPLIALPQER
jgi:hypothetical protein